MVVIIIQIGSEIRDEAGTILAAQMIIIILKADRDQNQENVEEVAGVDIIVEEITQVIHRTVATIVEEAEVDLKATSIIIIEDSKEVEEVEEAKTKLYNQV